MINQTYILNMIPGGTPPRIHVSQYDTDSRELVFRLYSGESGNGQAFSVPSDAIVTVEGTKSDRKGFSYFASADGNVVTVTITQQMTAAKGDAICELRITQGESVLGSANFILTVEEAALGEQTDMSETEIATLETWKDQALEAARNAAESEDNAATSADKAEDKAEAAAESATAAASSQNAALSAQTAAETAKSQAEAAQSAAEAAQSAAETAQEAAEAAKTSAQSSQQAAALNATDAADSASAAQTARTAAQSAQQAAESAKTAAETAKTGAETAAGQAQSSATAAAGSATTASQKADDAADSAAAAEQSSQSAAGSATSASQSAGTATAQATAASQSAQDAAGSATAASQSASSASTSATNAANDASAAAQSATDAESSAASAATSASEAASAAANAVAGKADKVTPSTAGNVALLASDGNLQDSGKQFTPAGIGAAPDGYGLGTTTGMDVPTNESGRKDLNLATNNGWYYIYFSENYDNFPGTSEGGPGSGYHAMRVDTFRGITQTIYMSYQNWAGCIAIRHQYYANSAWSNWCWVNPLMLVGVQYRTLENFNNKPVYKIAISCGAMPSANSTKTVSHGISNIEAIVSYGGYMTAGGNTSLSIPFRNSATNYGDISVDYAKITLVAGATSLSAYTESTVWFAYTLTTD